MPVPVPGFAPRLWQLDDASREDCVLLAHALPENLAPAVYSSDETKAASTADVIALRRGHQREIDPRFGEVDRGPEWVEDHRAAVTRYLSGTDFGSFEPHPHVVAHVTAAVEAALLAYPRGDLVVATHGQAMTLYLASRTNIDPVPFWNALTLPDAWRLDLDTNALTHVFGAGTQP